ncbi:hypothetical protein [Streptomyces sp. NPDC053720]|uniref:hypothetical protein n=1 Tax=Streptomyces sp. NPDC053720 TaxID=3154855 RepID=UPI00343801F5
MHHPALPALKPLVVVVDEAAGVLSTRPEAARLIAALVRQGRRPTPVRTDPIPRRQATSPAELGTRVAKPKFPMTLAKEAALDKAMAARQTCPGPCGRRYFHCIPLKTLGSCLECYDGTPADPASYIAPPAKHPLAA